MIESSDVLLTVRQAMKFYDRCLDQLRERYQLTKIEITIISFLHNHPGRDTVGEIADMRMLSRGNVSRGADSLIRRGLLTRIPDREDRRWVHLRIQPEAMPIVDEIRSAGTRFCALALEGFSPAELDQFRRLNQRLAENLSRNLEGSVSNFGTQK